MELQVSDTTTSLDSSVKEMCEKLLVNPVIEDYRYEVVVE